MAFTWSAKSVEVSAPGATRLIFHPDEDCVPFAAPIKDADVAGSKMTITLGDPEQDHTALAGVLEIRRVVEKTGKSTEFIRIRSAPKPEAPKPAAPMPAKSP